MEFQQLMEILYSSFKHPEIVVAGYIAIQAIADAFCVAHFAEHAAVRRGDARNGIKGVIGIEADI